MIFFDERLATFEIFSLSHLFADLFWAILILLMVVYRRRLRTFPRFDLFLRRFIAIAMLVLQAGYYAWMFATGKADFELLPLGLCHLSMYVTVALLLTQSKTLFTIIFPWAIIGAALSLILVDLAYQFPHFRYIHYFGNHGMFLFGVLYMAVVKGYRLTYKGLWMSGLVLIALAVIVYPINLALGTNHLFLIQLPTPARPIGALFGDWWMAGYVGMVFILFHLIYLPFFIVNRRERRLGSAGSQRRDSR